MRGTAESPLSMPLATTLAAQGVDLSTVGPTLPAVIDREYRSRELIGALAGRVDPRSDLAVRAALEAITDEVFAVTSFGRKDPPPIGPLANAEFMRRLFDGAFRWAMQRRDVAILSRLVAMAACIDLPIDDDRRSRFERFLHRHQLDDGSFGPTRPRATNSSREAVLMSILALSLLE